jgi:hypothetical protein
MVRDVFSETAGWFADTVAAVPADTWDSPALGVWTVRDLAGHVSRGLHALASMADPPAEGREIEGTFGFYARLFAPNSSFGDPADVAKMGTEFGQTLGVDPAPAVRAIVDTAIAFVAVQPDDALLRSPIGGIWLIDYLPARILEVTTHTLDLSLALGVDPKPPERSLSTTLHALADIAVIRGEGAPMLLSLAGRQSLPAGFSLML